MSGGAIFIIAICAAFPLLILVAVATKLDEVRQASQWPETVGKVLSSRVAARKRSPGDPGYNSSDSEVTNDPFVEYEYQVEKKKYRCHRITIGEKTTPETLEEILARYPVGRSVAVYYDPRNPARAVLERELPEGVLVGGVIVLGFFVLAPLLAAGVYSGALEWLEPWVVNPAHIPFVAASGGLGLAAGLFAVLFHRMTRQAGKWPTVPGEVLASGVESFSEIKTGSAINFHHHTHHKASVVYGYQVNGWRYVGDRVTLGAIVSSSLPGIAKRTAARFPVGSIVSVHYNPACPSESVLSPRSLLHVLPGLISIGLLVLAWAVATDRLG